MRDDFLDIQMRLLIARYGYREVLQTLASAKDCSVEEVEALIRGLQEAKHKKRARIPESYEEILEDVTRDHPESKALLEQLASLYQRRAFLPELRNVNHFLELHGVAKLPSSRKFGLRPILGVLVHMEERELRELLENASFSGPSRGFSELANEIMAIPRKP